MKKIMEFVSSRGTRFFDHIKRFTEPSNIEQLVTPNDKSVRRMSELDVLRGIAVFPVLGRHVLDIPLSLSSFVLHSFLIWRETGWIGVDLFFVLSGFLVSSLLFSEYRETGRVWFRREECGFAGACYQGTEWMPVIGGTKFISCPLSYRCI